jgi:hypothetical protein
MTTWNIRISGPNSELWLHQEQAGTHDRFVARFKYFRTRTRARAFIKFLTTHFTPEEYFAALDAGTAPLLVLQTKGFAG